MCDFEKEVEGGERMGGGVILHGFVRECKSWLDVCRPLGASSSQTVQYTDFESLLISEICIYAYMYV